MSETVRAAGGVLVRRLGDEGPVEFALVHRPKYEDWTLPKGKLEPGESEDEAAVREVREETGFSCALGRELDTTAYTDRHGRSKTVRWWMMTVESGEFAPNDEVDELRWLDPEAAAALLTYDRDRDLVQLAAGFR